MNKFLEQKREEGQNPWSRNYRGGFNHAVSLLWPVVERAKAVGAGHTVACSFYLRRQRKSRKAYVKLAEHFKQRCGIPGAGGTRHVVRVMGR